MILGLFSPEREDFCPSKKIFSLKREYSDSSENSTGTRVLSRPFLLKRENFCSSGGILA